MESLRSSKIVMFCILTVMYGWMGCYESELIRRDVNIFLDGSEWSLVVESLADDSAVFW